MKKWYIYDAFRNRVLTDHPFETEAEAQASIDNSIENYKSKMEAEEAVGNRQVAYKMKKELKTIEQCRPVQR